MSYTNIAKPTGATYTNLSKPAFPGTVTILKGMATGLLMPLTYYRAYTITTDNYSTINKPSGTSYTNISKPT